MNSTTEGMMGLDIDQLLTEAEALWSDASAAEHAVKAVQLFKQAHGLGEVRRSAYRLGNAYFYGKGAERDVEAAFRYLSLPELDNERYAVFFRGLILRDPSFSKSSEIGALRYFQQASELGVVQAASAAKDILEKYQCPICREMPDVASLPLGKMCMGCGSIDGERVFKGIWRQTLAYNHNLNGREGILVDPSDAEQRLFLEIGANTWKVVEALSDLSDIDSCSIDYIYSSYDFSGAPDVEAALSLIERILRPGGTLFLIEPQLGRAFLLEALSKSFSTLDLHGADKWTNQSFYAFAARKAELDKAFMVIKRRRYVEEIIHKSKIIEIEENCDRSNEYKNQKARTPYLTYMEFAMKIHAADTNRLKQHATLGENISERSRKQGHDNYILYRDILGVSSTDKVLEYGCGSLRVGIGFIQQLPTGHYFGLDVVPDFYDAGVRLFGPQLIAEKGVRFNTIDRAGVLQGREFRADHVFAPAVIFHIHPDDFEDAATNLIVLTSKPGAKLIFDCKLTRDAEPRRFAQTEAAGGWAWPLEFYRQAFAPLELVGVHNRVSYTSDPTLDFAHLEFRMPYGTSAT